MRADIEKLRRKLAQIVLDDYDRNTRPRLRPPYTLPGEPQRPGVTVRVAPKPPQR